MLCRGSAAIRRSNMGKMWCPLPLLLIDIDSVSHGAHRKTTSKLHWQATQVEHGGLRLSAYRCFVGAYSWNTVLRGLHRRILIHLCENDKVLGHENSEKRQTIWTIYISKQCSGICPQDHQPEKHLHSRQTRNTVNEAQLAFQQKTSLGSSVRAFMP